jgi:hypothetical protein
MVNSSNALVVVMLISFMFFLSDIVTYKKEPLAEKWGDTNSSLTNLLFQVLVLLSKPFAGMILFVYVQTKISFVNNSLFSGLFMLYQLYGEKFYIPRSYSVLPTDFARDWIGLRWYPCLLGLAGNLQIEITMTWSHLHISHFLFWLSILMLHWTKGKWVVCWVNTEYSSVFSSLQSGSGFFTMMYRFLFLFTDVVVDWPVTLQ